MATVPKAIYHISFLLGSYNIEDNINKQDTILNMKLKKDILFTTLLLLEK